MAVPSLTFLKIFLNISWIWPGQAESESDDLIPPFYQLLCSAAPASLKRAGKSFWGTVKPTLLKIPQKASGASLERSDCLSDCRTSNMGVIPAPLLVTPVDGTFQLPELVTVGHQDNDSRNTANYLVNYLQERLQLDSGAELAAAPEGGQTISLRLSQDLPNLLELPHNSEAYELKIQPDGISVSALQPHGLFNGIQSLCQLLPATPPADEVMLECTEVSLSAFCLLSLSMHKLHPQAKGHCGTIMNLVHEHSNMSVRLYMSFILTPFMSML